MDEASCSALSTALAEPLGATAPEASAWLLVEQPGAWGRKALAESQLNPEIGSELERRAKALGIKALLVKRPGRNGSAGRGRAVMLGRSDHGCAWLERATVEHDIELLELDLDGLAAGERGYGDPIEDAVYLVCTNGRRDACCAALGRPVAAVLAAARPERVWECSHIGGHRFAANLVCLPDGLCYGRVAADEVEGIAAAYEAGRIVVERLRGRSSFPPAVQAADAFLRAREGLDGLEALVLERCEAWDGGATVTFRAPSGLLEVDVRSEPDSVARPFSCGDETGEAPLTWTLAG